MSQTKSEAKKEKISAIEWLIDTFPAAFFKHGRQVKPLKIGVFDDILAFYERLDPPPYSKTILRDAVQYYSKSPAYLLAHKTHAARVDLYGNEIDLVTDRQAQYAEKRYQSVYASKKKVDRSL